VVTLAAGAEASARLQLVDVLNYATATCDPVSGNYLQVYPPGQTVPVYLAFKGQTCAKAVFALGVSTVAAAGLQPPGTCACTRPDLGIPSVRRRRRRRLHGGTGRDDGIRRVGYRRY
jgi:hypothetical protein